MFLIRLLICALVLAFPQLAADLNSIRAVPDLNKRAEMAMGQADESLDAASKAYSDGALEAAHTRLREVQTCAQLAFDSLRETRQQPRNNKYYKRVELSMRTLLRRLNDLLHVAPSEDESSVETVQKRVQELHDQILLDIMSKRK